MQSTEGSKKRWNASGPPDRNGCNACRPLLALFGPDGLAKRGLFVGVKRTSIQGAPTSGMNRGGNPSPPVHLLNRASSEK